MAVLHCRGHTSPQWSARRGADARPRRFAGVRATDYLYFDLIPGWLLFLIAVAVLVALFARSAQKLYRILRLGRDEDRFDRQGERIGALLRTFLGQDRILREGYAGPMHAFIFWGFLVITLNTAI